MTYRQPLRVIRLGRGKERVERVISGDDEAGNVGQELAPEVEDDEEEVQRYQTNHGIGLWNGSLPLEVVESGVLGELAAPSGQTNIRVGGPLRIR